MVAPVHQMNFPTSTTETSLPVMIDKTSEGSCSSAFTRSGEVAPGFPFIIHNLRCPECDFETIVRDRFTTHLPCAKQRSKYLLYSCAQCGACSTSKVIMNEHGSLYHQETTVEIVESLESFTMSDGSELSSSVANPTERHSSSSEEQTSSDAHRNPKTIKEQTGKAPIAGMPENAWSQFLEFVNHYTNEKSHSIPKPNQGSFSAETQSIFGKFTCPICPPVATFDLNEFTKHLALQHLLPLPAIMHCLSSMLIPNNNPVLQFPPISSNGQCSTEDHSFISTDRVNSSLGSKSSPNTKSETQSISVHAGKRDFGSVDHNSKESYPFSNETPNSELASHVNCLQCSRVFPNLYTLQMHVLKEHSTEFLKFWNPSNIFSPQRSSNHQTAPESSLHDFSNVLSLFKESQNHPFPNAANKRPSLSLRKDGDPNGTNESVYPNDAFGMSPAFSSISSNDFPYSTYKNNLTQINPMLTRTTGTNDGLSICSEAKRPRLHSDFNVSEACSSNFLQTLHGLPNPWSTSPLQQPDRNKNLASLAELSKLGNPQSTDSTFPFLFTECWQQLQLQNPNSFPLANSMSLLTAPPLVSTKLEDNCNGGGNINGSLSKPASSNGPRQPRTTEEIKKRDTEETAIRAFESSLVKQSPQGSTETPAMQNGLVHNTLRKTRSDMKVIHRYLVQVKQDTRDIHQIPYYELDQYIQDFVLTAKKKDGHEYEPESLKAFVHSLERHLKHHDYPHSVLKGSAFTGTRAVLNQRLNELRALSRSATSTSGNSMTSCNKRSVESADKDFAFQGSSKRTTTGKFSSLAGLLQTGLLGKTNPQAILNSLWLMNRTQFNIGGTQRHRNLVWGQFQLITDEGGEKVLKFTPLFESAEVRYCRGYGGSKSCNLNSASQLLTCSGNAKRQPLPFNCVELFELYANLRPLDARGVSEPFYLCPDTSWEESGMWFKNNAAGSQLLSRIPRLLGLKPSRQQNQTFSSTPGTQHGMEAQEKEVPYPFFPDALASNFHGRSPCDIQKALCPPLGNAGFPLPNPLLVQNLMNYIPFIFPPNLKSFGQTTPNFPTENLKGLSGGDQDANPSSVCSNKTSSEYNFPGNENGKSTGEQIEANDLSTSIYNYSLASRSGPDQTPPASSGNCPTIPSSSEGTRSPTDADNASGIEPFPRNSSTTNGTNTVRTYGGLDDLSCPNSHSSNSTSYSPKPHSLHSRRSSVNSPEPIGQTTNFNAQISSEEEKRWMDDTENDHAVELSHVDNDNPDHL